MSSLIGKRLYRLKTDQNGKIYFLLFPIPTEGLLYIMAKCDDSKSKQMISHFLTDLKKVHISINGDDLKRIGFEPGPIFKKIFHEVLQARLDGMVSNHKEEMQFVQQRFKPLGSDPKGKRAQHP